MSPFSRLDLVALAFFGAAWLTYYLGVERTRAGGRTRLNRLMDGYRHLWMERMLTRENRMVDTSIMAALQNGTAFSASDLPHRGRRRADLVQVHGRRPDGVRGGAARPRHNPARLGAQGDRPCRDLRLRLLQVRLVVPAVQLRGHPHGSGAASARRGDARSTSVAVRRVAALHVVAGKHFNRGQRAFFFALAYLGWFISAYGCSWAFPTAAVLYVIWRRQFASNSQRAVMGE